MVIDEREGTAMAKATLDLATLFETAHAAGMAAGTGVVPMPMVVTPVDIFDRPTGPSYAPIMDGVCGFAWITIRPGNSRAAKFAKANLGARPGYHGGMEIWVSYFNQSMTRKESYAHAFAKVLTDAGFTAYAGSRMD